MKVLLIMLSFFAVNVSISAQTAKVLKSVNDAGDVATFELDCSVKFQTLAKGLRYNITLNEDYGKDVFQFNIGFALHF